MNKQSITNAYREYELGQSYKRRLGLYETVRENERFYRGDQWRGVCADGLPTPVFNVIKRVVDYLISAVTANTISIRYADDSLPVRRNRALREKIADGVELLNKNAAYRYDKSRMDILVRRAMLDAAISGDGVFYVFWDAEEKTGQPYSGDIRTVLLDNVNLFVSDCTKADIQTQDYVMIAGRDTVAHLRAEARAAGASERDVLNITADEDLWREGSYAETEKETDSEEEAMATYLIKFYRDKDGYVIFEKATRNVLMKKQKTRLRRYPIAYFSWEIRKGSFHGTAPITSVIENQKYINKAYAMVMKHMTDTAFSKIIYDKTLIPEWSNEVGEAIGVRGGGDIRGAASVIGSGQLQSGFLEVISMTVSQTKEMMGATDTALGEVRPENTSAIIALQEASNVPLETVRRNLYACIEELALIWAEMLMEYYPKDRLLLYYDEEKNTVSAETPDFKSVKDLLISARIDVGEATGYSQIAAINTLGRLLEGGYIGVSDYLRRLPDGIVAGKEELIEAALRREATAGAQ